MNIADHFTEIAKVHHNKVAVKYPRREGKKYCYDSITFGELESLANKYANGLSKIGFSRGSKTLLFVRPSLKFPALVFALFKLGIVPVLIDPDREFLSYCRDRAFRSKFCKRAAGTGRNGGDFVYLGWNRPPKRSRLHS